MLRQVSPAALLIMLTNCVTTPTPASSLHAFNSTDPAQANAGYMELYHYDVRAIPLLLDNTSQTSPFAGDAYQESRQSITGLQPTQGLISLYLIEAIRIGHQHPHTTAQLIDQNGTTPPGALDTAVNAYKTWWNTLGKPTLEQVRKAPDPLQNTGLRWR